MGVIYKLKPEVIDYIVGQKKDIPQISCRKLADLVSEKFQANISKSSISAILKSAELSSPVGRRAQSTKSKKFTIPPEQKKRISTDLGRLQLNIPKAGSPVPGSIPEPKRKPAAKKQKKPQPKAPQKLSQDVPRLLPDPVLRYQPKEEEGAGELQQDFQKTGIVQSENDQLVPVASSPGPGKREIVYDGMGCFLLKAAEWDISNRPILADLLREYVHAGFIPDLHKISEILLFLEAFGIQRVEDIEQYPGLGLWVLNGLYEPMESVKLTDFVASIQNERFFTMKMSNERSQIFSEIAYFKFDLQDKTEFCVDAKLQTIWAHDVHSTLSSPLKKAVTTLSEQFINNVAPAILAGIPGKESFGGPFYQMVSAFEGVPGKKITRISLFGANDEAIAKFATVPDKKRGLIIGAWPWQNEFRDLAAESSHQAKYYCDDIFDLEIYYNEMSVRLNLAPSETGQRPVPLRAIFLKQELRGDAIAAVITNIPIEDMRAEEVLKEYLGRWPNLQKGRNDFLVKIQKSGSHDDRSLPGRGRVPSPSASGHPEIWAGIRTLLYDLSCYCQRHFFPEECGGLDFESMKKKFYGLRGTLIEDDEGIRVTLSVKKDSADRPAVEYAARRINESNILDNFGKKIFINISE